jgi:hypothetical protein
MIVGFDLDGVIFNPPLPFYGLIKKINLDFLMYRLKKIGVIKNAFYSTIKVNRGVANILNQLAVYGHRVVIISGHSDECVREVDECLKKNRVPFNGLHLFSEERHKSYSQFKLFKLEKIIEAACNFYVEDSRYSPVPAAAPWRCLSDSSL